MESGLGRRRRRPLLVLAVLAAALATSSCTSFATPLVAGAGDWATTDTRHHGAVVAAHGWTAALNSTTSAAGQLSLGAATGTGAAAAVDALTALQRLPGLTAGDPARLRLTDAVLPPAGATISRTLSGPLPADATAVLAYFDPAHDAWTAVPTTVSADRRRLTALVHHFSFWDDIVYRASALVDTRVPAPSCSGKAPSWAPSSDVFYLDDPNAPVRWCYGTDPGDSSLLVVKLAVNRGYGVAVVPKAAPQKIWDSLFQGSSDDILVRLFAGVLTLPENFGRGLLLVPGGAEADFTFTESAVRQAGGSPLVMVDPNPQYFLAGLTYDLLVAQLGRANGAGAMLAALLAVSQCASSITDAAATGDGAGLAQAAFDCLRDNSDDVARDLAGVLAQQFPSQSEASLGKVAGRIGGALWAIWAAEYTYKVTTYLADTRLDPAAWRFSVFPPPVRVPGVTAGQLLSAPVPAYCSHSSGRLVNGQLPGLGPSDGFEFISGAPDYPASGTVPVVYPQLSGGSERDAVAVLYCSAGGVSWPDLLLLYRPGPQLLGSVDLSENNQEHADLTSMSAPAGGTGVELAWTTYDGANSALHHWTATLTWDGRDLRLTNQVDHG